MLARVRDDVAHNFELLLELSGDGGLTPLQAENALALLGGLLRRRYVSGGQRERFVAELERLGRQGVPRVASRARYIAGLIVKSYEALGYEMFEDGVIATLKRLAEPEDS